jgi:calcineurin-like phosphoesterase family protein
MTAETVVTSDTHAFHANIIKYSNRPFANVDEMNRKMADNINAALPSGGRLIHCGDWAFGSIDRCREFRLMLNPGIEVTLILGNHDNRFVQDYFFRKLFYKIYTLYEEKWNYQKVTFCHYAMRVWNCSHHGAWHLYGHSHGSLPDDPHSLSFDCGVDCHNFSPLTFDKVRAIMSRKSWKPIDHHAPRQRVT